MYNKVEFARFRIKGICLFELVCLSVNIQTGFATRVSSTGG